MALFLDSSVIVKIYIAEKGSSTVRSIVAHPDTWGGLFISEISGVEVVSAFARKVRRGEIDASQMRTAHLAFSGHFREVFDRVPVDSAIIEEAVHIVATYADNKVDAGDGVQLACATYVNQRLEPDVMVVLASDRSMRNVVRKMGFRAFDPETGNPRDLAAMYLGLLEPE